MAFWDDVWIGTGNRGSGSSRVSMDYDNIYDNRVSFWINDCVMDTGMTIFKNTPEGIELAKMIAEKASPLAMQEFLDDLVLKNITPEVFKRVLADFTEKTYERGRDSMARDLRSLIGCRLGG